MLSFPGFNEIDRLYDRIARISAVTPDKPELDPKRMINRAIYGTDYDPNSDRFTFNQIRRLRF